MKTGRAEDLVQVLILIAIAGMAGAASFTHVHNWTMHNAPAGTGSWFGWANAIISELTPTAAGIEIRRRKRSGHHSIAYPMAILIAAAVLSLSAQVAEAQPTIGGWISSAVPALAFLALTKLILSRPNARKDEPAWNQNQAGQSMSTSTGTPTPDGSKSPSEATARSARHSPATPNPAPVLSGSSSSSMTTPSPAPAAAPTSTTAPAVSTVPDRFRDLTPVPSGQLLMSGRMTAFAHQNDTGQPITPGQLAERLGIPVPLAESLLDHLGGDTPPTVTAVNGTAMSGNRP